MRVSVDDGCALDTRLADMFRKYSIEATFYIPVEWHNLAWLKGYDPIKYKDLKDIAKDFEIGSHTITHRHLTEISYQEACYEIEYSKQILQDMLDVEIKRFCPPRGYTNDQLTSFTVDHYKYQRLTRGVGLVHVHPNSGANRNVDWKEKIKEGFTELWMHSWEVQKYDLWNELEEVLHESSRR